MCPQSSLALLELPETSFDDFTYENAPKIEAFLKASEEPPGGEGGIRTRGGCLAPTRFPGVRLKPLIHLSGAAILAEPRGPRGRSAGPNGAASRQCHGARDQA